MTADRPAGHRRPYVFPGRQKRLSIRVTDDEYADIATAAEQFGLTPTGFCAHAALDAARNLHTGTAERMEHEALGNLQAELFQTRVTLNQLRAELGQTTAVNSADDRLAVLGSVIQMAAGSLGRLEDVISRIHQRLAPHQPASTNDHQRRTQRYPN